MPMGGLYDQSFCTIFPLLSMHSEREQVNVNKINDDDLFCMFCGALLKRQNILPLYGEKSCGREGIAVDNTGVSLSDCQAETLQLRHESVQVFLAYQQFNFHSTWLFWPWSIGHKFLLSVFTEEESVEMFSRMGCACTLRIHVSLYFDGDIKDPSRE